MSNLDTSRPDNKDKRVFTKLIRHIINNPDEYHEAGRLLDVQYSESAILKRDEAEAKIDDGEANLEEDEANFLELKGLTSIPAREVNMTTRFYVATTDLLDTPPDFPYLRQEDRLLTAKHILILTWIVIDPDADQCDFRITELQDWPWSDQNASQTSATDDEQLPLKLQRHYAQTILFYWRPGEWCDLVHRAWKVVKDNHTEQSRDETRHTKNGNGRRPRLPTNDKASIASKDDDVEHPQAMTPNKNANTQREHRPIIVPITFNISHQSTVNVNTACKEKADLPTKAPDETLIKKIATFTPPIPSPTNTTGEAKPIKPECRDPHGPYMPPKWFRKAWETSPATFKLDTAMRRGKLHVKKEVHGKTVRNYYSVPDVMAEWDYHGMRLPTPDELNEYPNINPNIPNNNPNMSNTSV